jgi:hypothetical protein
MYMFPVCSFIYMHTLHVCLAKYAHIHAYYGCISYNNTMKVYVASMLIYMHTLHVYLTSLHILCMYMLSVCHSHAYSACLSCKYAHIHACSACISCKDAHIHACCACISFKCAHTMYVYVATMHISMHAMHVCILQVCTYPMHAYRGMSRQS